ncbi:ATP-binding cassette domain-containing protein [Jatrophihabitans sp. YIM 134969]
MSAALSASGVRVRRGRRDVVTGVDLHVEAGEVVAVLGPNGAGKSTLLAALGGTLPVAAGTLTRSGRVATVLQTPGLARRSARANVELALAWWGVPRGQRRARAELALQAMQAGDLTRRAATRLSGGEQRRIHLARAVAVAADVTLLDEPFDGLDPATHVALREDTVDALRATGSAVVVVLHDRADAWAVADRVVVLIDGTVRADAAPRDLLHAPPSIEVARFLGYDGEYASPDGLILTRAAGVAVDITGSVRGTVLRVIPTEDHARVAVDTGRGTVWALDPGQRCAPGDEVALRIDHGVSFGRT